MKLPSLGKFFLFKKTIEKNISLKYYDARKYKSNAE